MGVMMVRATVKPEHVDDVEVAAKAMFSAIDEAKPEGVRYASCKLADGVTFVALLEVEERTENPLPALPAFREFQDNLKQWMSGPPTAEQMTVVGSYRLF
jgi:hypothetical protein